MELCIRRCSNKRVGSKPVEVAWRQGTIHMDHSKDVIPAAQRVSVTEIIWSDTKWCWQGAIRSKRLRPRPSVCASLDKTVAGSWAWSPIRTTYPVSPARWANGDRCTLNGPSDMEGVMYLRYLGYLRISWGFLGSLSASFHLQSLGQCTSH